MNLLELVEEINSGIKEGRFDGKEEILTELAEDDFTVSGLIHCGEREGVRFVRLVSDQRV